MTGRCRGGETRRGRLAAGPLLAAAAWWLGVVAIVALASAGHLAQREAGPVHTAAKQRATITAIVRVEHQPERGEAGARLAAPVRVSVIALGGAGQSASAVAWWPTGEAVPERFDRVEVRARVTPGEAGRRESVVLNVREVLARMPPRGIDRILASLQREFASAADRAGGAAAPLLRGIVLGDTSRLTERDEYDLRAAGLTHLTAVSGAHVTIVLVLVAWAIARLTGRMAVRAALSVAGLAGFVMLIGLSGSVLRAAAMGLVAIVGVLVGRPRAGLSALGAAVLVLILLDPWLARDLGFGLSVAATGGLVLLLPAWCRLMRDKAPPGVALALGVPVIAQLACAPFVALVDPAVSLVALPANLLAAPVVPFVTIAGLAAVVFAPILPPVALVFAWCAALGSQWVLAVARWWAAPPWARIDLARLGWPSGWIGVALLAAISLGLVALLGWAAGRRPRTLAAVACCVAVLATLASLPPVWRAATQALPGAWPPRGWHMAACDVGQGSATVLATAPGRGILIDTGPADGGVSRCLQRLGIQRLDALVLSHFDADHVGAINEVVESVPVARAHLAPACPSDGVSRRAVAALGRAGVVNHWVEPGADAARFADGALAWQLLAPPRPAQCRDGPSPRGAVPPNDASLIVIAAIAGLDAIVPGDQGPDGQRRALAQVGAAVPNGGFDVTVVPHHGSSRQDERFAALVHAPLAIVSVGAENDYGHPTRAALELYRGTGPVLRTDRCGSIAVARVPSGLRVAAGCEEVSGG